MITLRSLIEKADGMVTLQYKAKTADTLKPYDKNSFLIKITPGEESSQVVRLSYGPIGSGDAAGTPKGWYLHRDTINNQEIQSNWLMEPGTVTIELAKSLVKPETEPETTRKPETDSTQLTEAKNTGYVLRFRTYRDFNVASVAVKAGLLDQYSPETDIPTKSIFFAIPNKMSANANARTFAKRLFADFKDLDLQFSGNYNFNSLTPRSLNASETEPII